MIHKLGINYLYPIALIYRLKLLITVWIMEMCHFL